MNKFKIGDKVKCIQSKNKKIIGITGTVSKINKIAIYCNNWSDEVPGWVSKSGLIILKPTKPKDIFDDYINDVESRKT